MSSDHLVSVSDKLAPLEGGVGAVDLPDLPMACVDGVGVRVGDSLYVGLGTAGRRWYALDLMAGQLAWRRCADFHATAPGCAAAVAVDGRVYVFGGFGRVGTDATTSQFDTAHCYDPQTDSWHRLPTQLPVGLTGASAIAVGISTVFFLGGYNREQFDDFHRKYEKAMPEEAAYINAAYMNRPSEQYAWNANVWAFDLGSLQWRNLGAVPHRPNCKAAAIAKGDDMYLFGGEVKPGLRATTIKHGKLCESGIEWCDAWPVPVEDGIAGAFAGVSGDSVVAAGGTHFPGAWARYEMGRYFAHEGLSKKWLSDVYVLGEGKWQLAGRLPRPRANGVCFEVNGGLLMVGGDTDGGVPCLDTWWLRKSQAVATSVGQ